jgi:hypothetical protein
MSDDIDDIVKISPDVHPVLFENDVIRALMPPQKRSALPSTIPKHASRVLTGERHRLRRSVCDRRALEGPGATRAPLDLVDHDRPGLVLSLAANTVQTRLLTGEV